MSIDSIHPETQKESPYTHDKLQTSSIVDYYLLGNRFTCSNKKLFSMFLKLLSNNKAF